MTGDVPIFHDWDYFSNLCLVNVPLPYDGGMFLYLMWSSAPLSYGVFVVYLMIVECSSLLSLGMFLSYDG